MSKINLIVSMWDPAGFSLFFTGGPTAFWSPKERYAGKVDKINADFLVDWIRRNYPHRTAKVKEVQVESRRWFW